MKQILMGQLNHKILLGNWPILVLALLPFFGVPVSAGTTPRSHCSETLPSALNQIIKHRYIEFNVLTKKDSRHGCPGIVKVDFYGDGRTVYAIVIRKPRGLGAVIEEKLLLAEKGHNHWKVTTLAENDSPGNVSHEPAGEYGDMYRTRSFRTKGDLIVYFGYESWAVGYGWTGEKIEEVQLTD